MKSIVTLTVNPAIDVAASVPKVFPDHKLRCGLARRDAGGGGLNVSRAIRLLGGQSLACYFAGGPSGEMLEALLEAEMLLHRRLPIKGWTRENFTATEEATGSQYRFVLCGPELSEEEWQRGLDLLASLEPEPDFAIASGSLATGMPDDFYARFARTMQERGARVIIDTSGQPLVEALRAGVFLIKPSLREMRALTGELLAAEAEQNAAAMGLIESGRCQAVMVSLGADGALLASRDGCERFPSPDVEVQSRVGAGDSMVAGIGLALVRGESLRDAARFGVAVGAAAVMTPGTELCRREDAERLFREMTTGSQT
ncbi:MAG: 1-phosphofructokinase family hexose kinase [Chthoniobacterales bacterium]